jgi:hypothetical protein
LQLWELSLQVCDRGKIFYVSSAVWALVCLCVYVSDLCFMMCVDRSKGCQSHLIKSEQGSQPRR